MRTIVFAAVFSALFLVAASQWQFKLPNQDARSFGEYHATPDKFGWMARHSRNSKLCQDDQDCFFGLMGKRAVQMPAARPGLNILQILRELQNRNLNPDYAE
ncbi:uncharacterized protein LOC103176445 [Callorhinchus milii]|uniref:uncharacterized protein LOC103176445 n=1 Tax=Callorhinchus milii TaxID=7868 RepID=UPI0004572DB3|nr:uncharacterized protein LOC103176445 [Callorhinchus milii]XP_007888179.1 uncharacterized protein LOC103176445 [Callorhinchus milii]|eukprot:gi/632945665/ref/XP_007888178.1/ PREDICTED: uncharacterized protein LOC103176445 [Callorhinchus milii]